MIVLLFFQKVKSKNKVMPCNSCAHVRWENFPPYAYPPFPPTLEYLRYLERQTEDNDGGWDEEELEMRKDWTERMKELAENKYEFMQQTLRFWRSKAKENLDNKYFRTKYGELAEMIYAIEKEDEEQEDLMKPDSIEETEKKWAKEKKERDPPISYAFLARDEDCHCHCRCSNCPTINTLECECECPPGCRSCPVKEVQEGEEPVSG